MDTSQLENIAEDFVSSQLQKNGVLVAKPKFDILGTDLLAFVEMKDGIKFCRLQSKGRSFSSSRNTNIKIPSSYVSSGFIVFLYLEFDDSEHELYTFFSTDIAQWSKNKKDEYQLSLSVSNAKQKLKFFKFDTGKARLIKEIIGNAESAGEFNRLVYGSINQTLPALTCSIDISVEKPRK